jgi:hypothetical protein
MCWWRWDIVDCGACGKKVPRGTFKVACDEVKVRMAREGSSESLYGSCAQYERIDDSASKGTCAACESERLGYTHGVPRMERRNAVCLTPQDLPAVRPGSSG